MRHSTAARSRRRRSAAHRPWGARPVVRAMRTRGCPQPTTTPHGAQLPYGRPGEADGPQSYGVPTRPHAVGPARPPARTRVRTRGAGRTAGVR
ncbi:hypothetical protein ACFWOB_31845 [Streptomyces sp. NPDC058420]|uniref:hypothetical protein n=1 Tax=Streptomyces sp. NPDC058420 TaxID=3346489 RepID=UPI0036517FE1